MQDQSTPYPIAPIAVRVALAIVLIGTGLGVMAYGALVEPALFTRVSDAAVAPTTTARARVETPDRMVVGAFGSFRYYENVWVDDVGLWAYNRALANRDDTARSSAMKMWESFVVPAGAEITITNHRGDAFQVEVLAGQFQGRRGWIDSTAWFVRKD